MSTFLRLCSLVGPFKRWLTLGVFFALSSYLSAVALAATSAYLIAKAAIVTDVAALAIAFASVRLFAISRAGFRYWERMTMHIATFRILSHLRAWFFAAVEPLAPAKLSRYHSGDLLTRCVADIQTLEGFYVRVLVQPVAAALLAVAASLLLATFDIRLGLCLLAFLVAAGVVVPLALHRLSAPAARETLATRANLHAGLIDGIQGAADLATLNRTDAQRTEMLLLRSRIDGAQERLAALRGAGNALTAFIVAVGTFSVLWLAIPLVTSGEIDGVYLALLALVSIAAFEAVQPLTPALQQLETGRAAGRRIFDLVDSPPAVVEARLPLTGPCRFDLELHNVSFRYEPEDPLVLRDVDFALPEGGRLAITGASGCGKSTLINLLLRFWEREAGSVTLGGYDIREYGLEALRSCFGVVPQDVYLFNASVRDNLLLANPDATDEDLTNACSQALLHDLIYSLPLGYDTPLGENGQLLSGGERQRLAIARVILKDAPIVLLDEPTANLDPDTERRLLSSLDSFLTGRSALIISHRKAVLETADRVLVMQDGSLTSPQRAAGTLPAGGRSPS